MITDVTQASKIKLKSGEEKDRRTVTIMDDSNASVDITFWGASALKQGMDIGKLIAVKDCRVSDYKGVSLNGPFDSNDIKLNE